MAQQDTPDALAALIAAGDLDEAVETAARLAHAQGGAGMAAIIAALAVPAEPAEADVPRLLVRSLLQAEAGNLVEAVKDAAAAVTLAPAGASSNGLLSLHMRAVNRMDEAALFAYEALKAAPQNPKRYMALASILAETAAHDAAEELLGVAAGLAPDDLDIVLFRMDCLMRLNRGGDAARLGDEARRRFGEDVRLLRNLGNALRQAELPDRARAIFEEILRIDPQDGYARHVVATLNGAVPDMADPEYVKAVFDRASADFETSMMSLLRCRIPGLVGKAVGTHAGRDGLEILDIGCGTGLCGLMLRENAAYLKGVDLSPGMVDLARAKGIYDDLEVAEITAMLAAETRSYDVVSAGDVMTYFGRLDPLLNAVRARLKPEGLCVFTVEISGEDVPVGLNGNGRFMHSPGEIRRVAAEGGYRVLALEDQALRMQNGRPVGGLLAVLRKEG